MRLENTLRWFFERLSNVSVYLNHGQVSPSGVPTTIEFDAVTYDNLSEFNTDTYTFTALNAGFYLVKVCIDINPGASSGVFTVNILTTGATVVGVIYHYAITGLSESIVGFVDVELAAGATIYVSIDNGSANNANISTGATKTFMEITRIPIIT